MTSSGATGRGRPRAASRQMLEDAAFELFLENGYSGTTVDQIAQRAGVSRNTFFNYFDAKSDVFWGEIDAAIDELPARLAEHGGLSPVAAILESALVTCGDYGPSRVPWLLTQYELIGPSSEVQASALLRFTRLAGTLSTFTGVRLGEDPTSLTSRWIGYAATAAIVAAAQDWAGKGEGRGTFGPFLTRAFAPVLRSFA